MRLQRWKSALRPVRKRWPATSVSSVIGLGLLVGTLNAGAPAGPAAAGQAERVSEPGHVSAGTVSERFELDELERRVKRLTSGWGALETHYRTTVAPIERVLLRYGAGPELAARIAVALVREAHAVGLEPRLLLAVLLVENPWLDPLIRSPVGAVGLMQVMPMHAGHWPPCEANLEDIDANICHGARIFARYFEQTGGNIERALLRYNGCVRGTNTPNCHQYPYHVFARAGRAAIMAWADPDVAWADPDTGAAGR
jgi:soluble lytic murein transglycosylase-like protein